MIAELLEYAEREFELSARRPDGSTGREHAEALALRGAVPPELAPLPFPEGAEYLWGYFQSMSARRSSNGYTVNPLSHQEVQAWAARHGVVLAPWEAQVLDQLEELYMTTIVKGT